MSFMSKIAKLDSAMQRGLDNSFARVFGGHVVPAEIEELLKQEAEDNLVRTYEGTTEAPNVFSVRVSTKDFEKLSAEHPHLGSDFADQLSRFIRNKNWTTPGFVVVTIECDESLRTGQLRAESLITDTCTQKSGFISIDTAQSQPSADDEQSKDYNSIESPSLEGESEPDVSYDNPITEHMTAQAPPPSQPRATTAVSLLLQDGSSRTYYVNEGSNIIGRGNDVDFRLPDTGVSRQHAEIIWNGQDAILVDLQSTNGTTVNDTPIDNWLLADGDVITVGHSHIEVRIVN
ncbi:FHA domain-containing protein [Corynebacterium mustelae]|uniref:FHA domain-containing protein n=1 Tax=Corynebacterium mustelae TaxID=571915 RepID=A0A0G3GTA9_9CORY|nr:DUF3662 and FHA domain-containing protein [Corynebacterium mustelae]AKK04411.1 FHA domain-containing protein [Corynebacterium mustelae]